MILATGISPLMHRWTVTSPAQRHFEAALEEVVSRERAQLKQSGRFSDFSSEAGALGQALPGINETALHADTFAFRGVVMPDGRLTVTAWTRPEAVLNSGIPPFATVYEFFPDGKVLRKEHASGSE